MSPVVLTATNMRGGVAKTTTAVNVGHKMAREGYRVLLIDCDSQRTATLYLGIEVEVAKPTLYAAMTEPTEAHVRGAIKPYIGTPQYRVSYPNGGCLHVLPGARTISNAYGIFQKSRDRQPVKSFDLMMLYFIQKYLGDYHYIWLDPSPATDEMTRAVANTARGVIAPHLAEPLSIKGVPDLLDDLTDLNNARADLRQAAADSQERVEVPAQVDLLGLLAAKVLVEQGQTQVAEQLWSDMDDLGIGHFQRTIIPCTQAGWAAPGANVPISVIAPNDRAAQGYDAVTEEVIRWSQAA